MGRDQAPIWSQDTYVPQPPRRMEAPPSAGSAPQPATTQVSRPVMSEGQKLYRVPVCLTVNSFVEVPATGKKGAVKAARQMITTNASQILAGATLTKKDVKIPKSTKHITLVK